MKRYTILILSFILSIVLFFTLLYTQKNILDKSKLGKVYVLNQDIDAYTEIKKEMYDIFYAPNNDINKYEYLDNEESLNNMICMKSINKGSILSNNLLINISDKEEYISKNKKEIVLINIKNDDKKIGQILNENNYINLYITINSNYVPKNINNLKRVEYKSEKVDQITFLYLEKFMTYSIIYEDEVTKKMLSSIALELSQEQANYINSIKDIADFSISVI